MLVGGVVLHKTHFSKCFFGELVIQEKEFGTHCAECLQRDPTQESMVIYVTSIICFQHQSSSSSVL